MRRKTHNQNTPRERNLINEKTLHRYLKNNLKSIIAKDHDDAKVIVRNAGSKSQHVPLGMAAKIIRKVLVNSIGDKILTSNKENPESEIYEESLETYENECSFLKYHKDGKEKYNQYIEADIKRVSNALSVASKIGDNLEKINPITIAEGPALMP